MPPKLLLTGATGYIGGSVFATLAKKHPEYDITVLLRNPPPNFSTQFPNTKVIIGDFDNHDLISNAAAEVDIAIHNGDGDHAPAIHALIAGLARRTTPTYLIKLSGTGLFYDYPDTTAYLGRLSPAIYSDLTDITAITSRPPHALHRATDAIVQDAAEKYAGKLRTAIVCPPDVYGRGSGPGRKMSYYVPWFVEGIRQVGAPFYLEEGENVRGWVHIEDFVQIYVKLVEAAVEGGGKVTWGKEGYFLASTQEYTQKQIATTTAHLLHAAHLIPTASPKSLSASEMRALWPDAPDTGILSFGCNSRTRAERAAEELGFVSRAPGLWDVLGGDLVDAFGEGGGGVSCN